MKIAIISDIHGNYVSLEAALADIDKEAPDQIICLGDVVVLGPQPEACLERIQSLNCPVVMGNTDEWALNPTPHTIHSEEDQFRYELEMWCAQQMSADHKVFISTFQPTLDIDLGYGRTMLCFHGSPNSNKEVINAQKTDEDLAAIFGEQRATVMVGGHTHTPMLRRWQNNFILNPGSVGLPVLRREGKFISPSWAEYAIVTSAGRDLHIDLRRVFVDVNQIRQSAIQRGEMPHIAYWTADWEEIV